MPAPLSPEVRARLKSVLLERVLPRFGDEPKRQQSAAARALKMEPSSINRLVNHNQGGSLEMIEKVEHWLNLPKGTILGYMSGEPAVPRFRDLAGFQEAIGEAERRAKAHRMRLSRQDLELAADVRASPPVQRVSADLLIQYAIALVGEAEPDDSPRKPKRRKK
jgi:hypothetical protein